MDADYDIVVIGGGLAGLTAGISAAQMNANTLVVRKGEGATSLSSGALDIAGYLRGGETPFLTPEEGVAALAHVYPFHPYSVLESIPSLGLKEIVSWLKDILAGSPSAMIGSHDTTTMALTILGTKKPTCLVQRTMHTTRLDNTDETLLFAGIKGLADFNPSTASKALMESVIAGETGPHKIVHTLLECSPFRQPSNISPVELARYIETEDGLDRIIKELQHCTEQTGTTLIALPPILGLVNPIEIKKRIEEETGTEIFELLSFPPSVPGYRLQRSLEASLKKAGGTLLVGHEAVSFKKQEGKIIDITLKSPRRTFNTHPKSVILATGKFVGGGLAGNRTGLRETVFDLPVLDGTRQSVQDVRPSHLTRVVPLHKEGHPLFECGIGFDTRFRPIDVKGDIFASNLFAAGSVLCGYNYPVEKSGLGVALVTGRICGVHAAENVTGGN